MSLRTPTEIHADVKRIEAGWDLVHNDYFIPPEHEILLYQSLIAELAAVPAVTYREIAIKLHVGTQEGAGAYHDALMESAWDDADRLLSNEPTASFKKMLEGRTHALRSRRFAERARKSGAA
ncbi:hypothetical protein GCM10011316_38570 [Roseibium aquae]|uniref:Uncharacterized protein n=1 Tax=Roseibium aquae TaxID=1323746 RepID=A0A916TMZ5_9HYPH|nr:transmembrane 9 family protein [Roseibium aquae]GGB62961.1 hypothetical protein GCM10011316_38570 [Roseibium aquae]